MKLLAAPLAAEGTFAQEESQTCQLRDRLL